MLFPSLTGLFAMSTLLVSLSTRSTVPPQGKAGDITGNHRKGIFVGWLAGWLAGMLPGVGASQAGVLAAQALRAGKREFLVALGGINTSNILFTFIMFCAIGKTRSGAMWAMSQFASDVGAWLMVVLVLVGVATCFISAGLTITLARLLIGRLGGADYRSMNLAVMLLLVAMVLLLSGPAGALACLTGTFIGLLSIAIGARRSNLMGFLLLPTILYFSGIMPEIMLISGM